MFMEIREHNGIEYKIISPDDLAVYIEKVYNHPTFRTFLLGQKTKGRCEQNTDRLSDILVKYYVATGDDRDSSIERIVEAYANNPVDYRNVAGRNDIKFHQFRHTVFPFAVEYWKEQLGKEELTFEELKDLLIVISTQSSINRFETHSFNGALKDKVNREGLNINSEMFRDNFDLLSHISHTPYNAGVLYLCNLSESSWGYMHHSPERLWMTIGSSSVSREEGETDNEFAKRNLDAVLANGAGIYDENYLLAARNAGEEMIDFYTQSEEACIAICRRGANPDIEHSFEHSKSTVEGSLKYSFELPYSMQRSFPRELVSRLNGSAIRGKESMAEIEAIIEEMRKASPGKSKLLDEFVANVFSAVMATYCVSNYMHEGMSDGITVQGGKLPRESFALATVRDPAKEYDINKTVKNDPKR